VNELERRYRSLLRFFPRGYRRQREDEMVAVLMAAAAPGQRRPSAGETWALLGQAGRVWARLAVSPDAAANRAAASMLSVLLPLVLLFPVASTVWAAVREPWSFLVANHPDQGAWALWGIAAIATVVAPAGWARWPAIAGTLWFGGVLVRDVARGGTYLLSVGFGYLAIQLVACVLLSDPDRLRAGRRLVWVHRRWLLIAGAVAALLLAGGAGLLDARIAGVYWPSVVASVLLVAALAAGIRSPLGRALVVVLGPLFAAYLAGHGWWTGIGGVSILVPTTNAADTAALAWLFALPVLTWAGLRAAAAVSGAARR
jgi:hypothetical protein